jgi:hypothetical protein
MIHMIAITVIMGLIVALSYRAGIEQGKRYNPARLRTTKVIHMETIHIDENKWCHITKSINRII